MSYNKLEISEYDETVRSITSNLFSVNQTFDSTLTSRLKYQSLVAAYINQTSIAEMPSADSIFKPLITPIGGVSRNDWLSPEFTQEVVHYTSETGLLAESLQDADEFTGVAIKGRVHLRPSGPVSAVRIISIGSSVLRSIWTPTERVATKQMISGDTIVWVNQNEASVITLDFDDAFVHTLQLLSVERSPVDPVFNLNIPLANVESFKVLGNWKLYKSLPTEESMITATIITQEEKSRQQQIVKRANGTFHSNTISINPLALTNTSNPIITNQTSVTVRLAFPSANWLVLSDIRIDYNPR